MSEQTEQAMTEAILAHIRDESGATIEQLHGIRLRAILDVSTVRADGVRDLTEYRGIGYVSTHHPLVRAALMADPAHGYADWALRSYPEETR